MFEAAASNISVDNSNVNESVQPMLICVCVITICILVTGMLVLQTLSIFFFLQESWPTRLLFLMSKNYMSSLTALEV